MLEEAGNKKMATAKPTLTPYLNFNGKTSEAMKFYQSILGGELKMQTFGEAKMAKSPKEKDLILHADLKNDSLSLMASDGQPNQKVVFGDNIHMSIAGEDKNKLTEIFTKLGRGGKVDMPLEKQFWGDTFGMVTDKFGVHWMVNIAAKAQ
jgi:PhnB protein